MAAPAAVLSILVRANTGSATTGLIRFNQQLDATDKHSHKAARAIETVAKAGALIGGAAVIGGLTYAVSKAADFEQQMSSLGAVADASSKQMGRFRKQALKAGADTKFSALEAAQAQTELAKGGLTVQQIMKGGLRSALALAAAGEMDLADAATATVNAIKLFGLHGKDAMKVADGFATAANTTTADVKDFAMALSQGGSAAKAAGLSFNETVATLEALAEVGIKNSDAGTSMKTALVQLASPTQKALGVMDQLGLSFFKANGEMKSVVDISDMLRKKTGDLTREQRLQAFTTLVGTDGMRALLALYDAGPKKLQGFEKGLNRQGTAADVAKKKQDNLKGSLENLKGSVETFAIQIGEKMIPAIRNGADELQHFTNRVGRIFARDDLSLGEKLNRAFKLAKVQAQPWIDKLKAAIDRADIPGKLAAIISGATPIIVKAAAAAGLATAKTFIGAFAQSDMWGKLVLGGWLFSRMGGKGAFFKMGAKAGGAFGAGMQTGMPAARGASDPANRGAPLAVAAAAGGLASKAKGLLKTGGKLAGKFAALDLAINLVDSKGNLLAAGVNTAHDLTFGIVPKIHVKSGSEKTNEQLVQFSRQLDDITKKRDLSALDALARKLRGNAEYARGFKAEPVAKEYDKLANKANRSLGRLMDQERNAKGASGRFADSIRGLRLSGSKDFDKLVSSVTSGSRQILRIGGGNTKQTQQEISHQFAIARTRVKQSMDAQVISVRQGSRLLHTLAVKELGLYGIKAGRVNVVLAKGANGQMRPNARGGFQHSGEGTGDSIPSMLERGEYVVNRKAVQKVGKDRLDALNFGMAPRFQEGGIAGMMQAASRVNAKHFPYVWGGGHERTPAPLEPFDCSGAVSYVLQQGGVKIPTMVSGALANAGKPGPGAVTVFANAAHTFMRIAGRYFGTSGSNPGGGAGWFPAPDAGYLSRFTQRHFDAGAGMGEIARVMLQGPSSVALEAGQGALDRIRSAANARLSAIASTPVGGGDANVNGGGQYDKAALKALWVRANGGLGDPNLMAAIALAESGGNPGAHNPSGATGLWQILGNPFPGDAYDPATNARMAGAKLRSQGLGAWEAYTNGNYRSFLQRGGIAGMAKGGSPSFGARLVGELNTKTGKLTGGPSATKLIRQIGNTPNRKLRRSLVSDLLDKVKDVKLPDALRDRLSDASRDANVFDDYANRAEAIGGPVNGKSQSDWLGMELDALFRWRNAIIEAQKVVADRREKIAKLVKLAQKKLAAVKKQIHAAVARAKTLTRRQHDLQGQLRKAKKHPKANKTLIAALGSRLDAVGHLLGGTTRQQHVSEGIRDSLVKAIGDSSSGMLGRAGKLKDTAGTLGSSLTEVQGLGSPKGKLRRLPTIGVLGGRILDTQMLLRGLSAPTDATDTSGSVSDGASDTSAALAQLLQQANLRTAVSEAQFKVFRDMPPYGGAFATGGVVPGGVGEPRMAVVHGGEGVFTPDQMAAIGGGAAPIVNVYVDPAMAFLQKFIRVEVEGGTRRQARSASRALPGRPGSLR